MLHEFSPNSRMASIAGQSDSGGLSTVMELAASDEPNTKAFHDCEPACAAAA